MSKKSSFKEYMEHLPRCLKFLKNSSENTKKAYFQSIRKYEEFHNQSIEELVLEALDEQDKSVPMHRLSIIKRIEEFQDHLIGQGYVYNTIRDRITHIKAIYHKNRVHIPYIEPLNPKQIKRREYIEYKDILTKEEIRCALKHMRLPSQARAMVMAQGGLSNEECEHLKLSSFIDETYKYHKCDDVVSALEWLSDENHPIIWVTKLIRVKTGKPYYAIIGSEAINKIAEAKLYEFSLPSYDPSSDKLLSISKDGFARVCRRVNDRCGFGKVAEESKFRSHMLRKYHATHINGSALNYEEQSLISLAEIDEMQGRGKTATQDTYIKTNPIRQKVLYAKVMNNVSFHHTYTYEIVDDDVIIHLEDPLKKSVDLEKKVKNLTAQLSQRQKASEEVKKLREELGNDVFDSMIADILNAS